MDLNSILEAVARGKMQPENARKLIDKLYGAQRPQAPGSSRPDAARAQKDAHNCGNETATADKEMIKGAFERLRKTVHIDELIKISSGLVHSLTESMPNQIEKIQENFSQNFNALGFSPNTRGVDARLSVFRTFHVSDDSQVENNQVVGSQWFGVNFAETAAVKENAFTAVQLSELAVVRSDLCANTMALSRLSNVTLQEARFDGNKLARTTFSDVSVTESDFTRNKLSKSEFSQTIFNASRILGNAFVGADFAECEFDQCDVQGLVFENCSFRECLFRDVEIVLKETVKISNRAVSGKTIRGVRSVEQLIAALEAEDEAEDASHDDASADFEIEGSRGSSSRRAHSGPGADGPARAQERGGRQERADRPARTERGDRQERKEPVEKQRHETSASRGDHRASGARPERGGSTGQKGRRSAEGRGSAHAGPVEGAELGGREELSIPGARHESGRRDERADERGEGNGQARQHSHQPGRDGRERPSHEARGSKTAEPRSERTRERH